MSALSVREQVVLKVLIQEHVNTAQPVSSQTVCERLDYQWSPATIRNDMAGLEEKGFVNHPYTSAGKTPTVKAYQYFVGELLQKPETGNRAARPQQAFRVVEEAGENAQILRLTAKVLALSSKLLAVTWFPCLPDERLAHVSVLPLTSRRAWLRVRAVSGEEHQQLLELEEDCSPAQWHQVTRWVNEYGNGRAAWELEKLAQCNWSGMDQHMVPRVKSALRWIQQVLQFPGPEKMAFEGAANLLQEPEFNDILATRKFLEMLDQRMPLFRSLQTQGIEFQGMRVVIAEDAGEQDLPALAMVVEEIPWGFDRRAQVGVIGPRRMCYERIIPLVQEAAEALGQAGKNNKIY